MSHHRNTGSPVKPALGQEVSALVATGCRLVICSLQRRQCRLLRHRQAGGDGVPGKITKVGPVPLRRFNSASILNSPHAFAPSFTAIIWHALAYCPSPAVTNFHASMNFCARRAWKIDQDIKK